MRPGLFWHFWSTWTWHPACKCLPCIWWDFIESIHVTFQYTIIKMEHRAADGQLLKPCRGDLSVHRISKMTIITNLLSCFSFSDVIYCFLKTDNFCFCKSFKLNFRKFKHNSTLPSSTWWNSCIINSSVNNLKFKQLQWK